MKERVYIYTAMVRRVVDGDTIDVDFDLGFDSWLMNQRIRLHHVDTPETRTRDAVEKRAGYVAKECVERFCPIGSTVLIETEYQSGSDKFGRILGTVYTKGPDQVNVNEYLIENNYAVRYEGQNKELVEEEHQLNYQILTERGEI